MMRMLAIIVVLIALTSITSAAEQKTSASGDRPARVWPQQPSEGQIREWWSPGKPYYPEEKLIHIGEPTRVTLESGEKAFLYSVSFDDRPRYAENGVLLVRPSLKVAEEIMHGWAVDVKRLDGSGVSAIVGEYSFSGQGETSGIRKIFRLDGDGGTVILHEREFGDDFGNCGEEMTRRGCNSKQVFWSYTDLDGDGTQDLIETLVFQEGDEPNKLKWRIEVRTYLYKDKKFVPVGPNLETNVPKNGRR